MQRSSWTIPRLLSVVLAGAIALLDTDCSSLSRSIDPSSLPVQLSFLRGAGWDYPHEGFDPDLPGYRLRGGIGTIYLTCSEPPEEFVLEIRTTPAMRPNLEGFTIHWAESTFQTSPFAQEPVAEIFSGSGLTRAGPTIVGQTYVAFSREGGTVRVRFLPPALALLPRGCTVSWVDWYRR